MGRHDKPRGLARRDVGTRSEKMTIRVFTEGTVTEVDYFNAVKQLSGVESRFHIEIADYHGAPKQLLDKAAHAKRSNAEIDQCWCIFDVEWPKSVPQKHHPNLLEVIKRADSEKDIKCGISNPTFELWLILHHKPERRFLLNEDAERERHELDGSQGKHLNGVRNGVHYDGKWYAEHMESACRNAKVLADYHAGMKQFPEDNPSSTVGELVRVFV